MNPQLTRPLIVPEYDNGIIKLYTPDAATGAPVLKHTINVQTVLNGLVGGTPATRTAKPNCCAVHGSDLFASVSSNNAQAIIKFPGYLVNNASAVTNAFIFDLDANDYVGLAFDGIGNLYAAAGDFLNNSLVKYTGTGVAFPGAAKKGANNYATRTVIGNAGLTSYFANIVFDSKGILWATDYSNHRVVSYDGANFRVLGNFSAAIAVANTTAGLTANTAHLFTEPEGIDVDGNGNIWVACNNDGGGAGSIQNNFTTIVKLTPALQAKVLAVAAGGSFTPTAAQANTDYFVYQLPASASGRPQFGGLQIDRAVNRIFVNEEIAGNGRWYDIATIAATPASATATNLAITSTNPGNGGIALAAAQLLIKDDAGDTGAEPNTTTTRAWESPDIWLRKAADNGTVDESATVLGGSTAFVTVRIKNTGVFDTAGNEQLKLYWAKGGTGLGWPAPWDSSANNIAAHPDYGNSITVTPITLPVIAAGAEVIVNAPWVTPNPTDYKTLFPAESTHFCLLARIEVYPQAPFGMTFSETGALQSNVLNNAKTGWRNVNLVPVAKMESSFAGIIAANYDEAKAKARLAFELQDENGKPVDTTGGNITIMAIGTAREKLFENGHTREQLKDNGNGQFSLVDIEKGIDNIMLNPNETLALSLQYKPAKPIKGYILRVMQYSDAGTGEQLIGGQTFVYGNVKDFTQDSTGDAYTPPKPVEPPVNKPSGKKKWWWICILLLLMLLMLVYVAFFK